MADATPTLEAVVAALTDEQRRTVKAAMLRTTGFIEHHLDSYNRFMEQLVPHMLHENSTVTIDSEALQQRHVLEFQHVSIVKPRFQEASGESADVLPQTCRQRGVTYSAAVLCDIQRRIYDLRRCSTTTATTTPPPPLCSTEDHHGVLICHVPVMVKSHFCHLYDRASAADECPYDVGGYFIVNGNEKVIISQRRRRINYPCIYRNTKPQCSFSHVCEVRSCHESKLRSTSTLYIHMSVDRSSSDGRRCLHATIPFLKFSRPGLPIRTLFRMVGVEDPRPLLERELAALGEPGSADASTTALRDLLREVFGTVASDTDAATTIDDLYDWIGRIGTTEQRREQRIRYVEHIVANELLPHLGLSRTPAALAQKAGYLAYMVVRLCRVELGQLSPDEKDYYGNARIEAAGPLLATLFRQYFRQAFKSMAKTLRKNLEKGIFVNPSDAFNPQTITSGLNYALSTGNWCKEKRNVASGMGVAQMHSHMTFAGALSNLRRVNTPLMKEGKMPKPRQLYASSWGIMCPVETPEGSSCGLLNNFAVGCHVRQGTDTALLFETVAEPLRAHHHFVTDDAAAAETTLTARLFINGIPHGTVRNPAEVVALLRAMRRRMAIPFDTSVTWMRAEHKIDVDAELGGCTRPLFVLENIDQFAALYARYHEAPTVLWCELLCNGVVEYVDKNEEETLRVAVQPTEICADAAAAAAEEPFTHLEIHPTMILGVAASMIPFSDHNQAPRNSYQAAMGKQAMSQFAMNLDARFDAFNHTLWYPQVPLVRTDLDSAMHTAELPMGQNIYCAIVAYTGYNQEDSLIVDQSALERGLMRAVTTRSVRDQEKRRGADTTTFCNPCTAGGEQLRGLHATAAYEAMTDAGFPLPGSVLPPNAALIGKTMDTCGLGNGGGRSSSISVNNPIGNTDEDGTLFSPPSAAAAPPPPLLVKQDNSTFLRSVDPVVVDCVLRTRDKDGGHVLRVRTALHRPLKIGDKLAARHGQKGTVGMVYRQEDMPFTTDGRPISLLINPHSLPSRMTIGMLLEMLTGKACVLEGCYGDGTAFASEDDAQKRMEHTADILRSFGLQSLGHETLMRGDTGEVMDALVFRAPCFYQRLKHLVDDKIHARARGPVSLLTRQPREGRSNDGGFRLGEMERDCMIAHGVAHVLRERLFEQSDPNISWICTKCGMLAEPPPPPPDSDNIIGGGGGGSLMMAARPTMRAFCRNCGSDAEVVQDAMPYATKLMTQEQAAAHNKLCFELDGGDVRTAAPTLKRQNPTTCAAHTRPSRKRRRHAVTFAAAEEDVIVDEDGSSESDDSSSGGGGDDADADADNDDHASDASDIDELEDAAGDGEEEGEEDVPAIIADDDEEANDDDDDDAAIENSDAEYDADDE